MLGGLLSATTMRWSDLWDRRTISQIYQDAKDGRARASTYAKIIVPVSLALIAAGVYLATTGR